MELLVVMALMSILWGVAYVMFYQSKVVFSLSISQLEMYQHARIAIGGISQDLKGAALKNNTDYFKSFTTADDDVSELTPPPRQNSSILAFLSLTPNGSSTPVTLIAYYLNNADELMRAEYNDTSYIYDAVSESGFNLAAATFYILATNVNYFNLAYNDGNDWVSSWDSTCVTCTTTGLLPNSIRVILQIYGSGTGNTLKVGTFTTEIAIPYRITHEDEHVDGDEEDDDDHHGDDDDDDHGDDDDDDHHDDDDDDDHHGDDDDGD